MRVPADEVTLNFLKADTLPHARSTILPTAILDGAHKRLKSGLFRVE